MLNTSIFWLRDSPGGLAIMPRPRGHERLQHEVENWHREGLTIIVSLLDQHEVKQLGLTDEPTLCKAAGIEFICFPVSDRGVPESLRHTARLADDLSWRVASGSTIGVHCRAGIGRSALLAACVLSRLGMPEREVFPWISRVRGVPCPDTEAQAKWFARFVRVADSALKAALAGEEP